MMPSHTSKSEPFIHAAVGHDQLINFEFILDAPWKACRLCGAVYQSDLDRDAYILNNEGWEMEAQFMYGEATRRRERWEKLHNRRYHPDLEKTLAQLKQVGMFLTPEAAQKLSTYGIIHMGATSHLDEIDGALFEAPRAPINDVEG